MDYQLLAKTHLFRGITTEEIANMMPCLSPVTREYEKNTMIYRVGDVIHTLGIVLHGTIYIENDDFWGNKSILNYFRSGQIFAESYACSQKEPLLVNVVAKEPTSVLFLNVQKLLSICPNTCSHHHKLIHNLLEISAQKNILLSHRIFFTASKTIRGRLLSYLSYEATQNGSNEFDLPFNRQQLADYLNVDRSALSNELTKMQAEHIINYHKNHFQLLEE